MISSPYVTQSVSVTGIMFKVLLALVPGIAAFVWQFGPAVLVTLALATITALIAEALMLALRRAPLKPFLLDLSAVVTAWLFALSLPPLCPWWLTVSGTLFAIIVAKHLYGGLGANPFNPAMAAYAVLLLSFPLQMTHWTPPLPLAATRMDFATALHYMFENLIDARLLVDAETMATPLDTLKTQLGLKKTLADIAYMPVFGRVGGSGFEIIAIGFALGGLYLWQQKIITWHMPAAYLGAMIAIAGALHFADSAHYASAWFHLATGGSVLAAFFIVTDPVSGATTPRGKLIFGAGAGLLTYVIRVFGGYADGIAFATLIMNLCVPLIDAYTQPRIFGRKTGAPSR